jgi:RNA polymerase sigma-70 factor (ECF subfamily)
VPDRDPDADLDDQLLARAGGDDRRAFEALVGRHLDRTYALARRLTGSDGEAEDVTQEVFTRVWLKAPTWRPGQARFSTWLYRVTANLSADARRRRGPPAADLDPEDPALGSADPAEDLLAAGEEEGRLAAAVAALPERQRAAVALTYTSGLTNAEAAAVMEVSVKAFEGLLVRAKRELRRRLAEEVTG